MNSTAEVFSQQRETLKSVIIKNFEDRTSLKFEENDAFFEDISKDMHKKLHKTKPEPESTLSSHGEFLRYFMTTREFPIILSTQDREDLITYCYSYDFDSKYKLKLANREELELIYELAGHVYGGFDVIHVDVLRKWYDGNPNCFWLVCDADQNGKMVGNVDVLPLYEAHPDVQKFLNGTMLEKDMGTDCIVPENKIQEATLFYVESVVSYDTDRSKPVTIPLRGIMQKARSIIRYIAHYKLLSPCRLCCIAASGEGVALIEHLGFKVVQPKDKRVDEHNLYMINMEDFMRNINKFIIKNTDTGLNKFVSF